MHFDGTYIKNEKKKISDSKIEINNKCEVLTCCQRQIGLFVKTINLSHSELLSEKVCGPTHVADYGQVAFVAMERPLKQLQVSSLTSAITPRAEQNPTATV